MWFYILHGNLDFNKKTVWQPWILKMANNIWHLQISETSLDSGMWTPLVQIILIWSPNKIHLQKRDYRILYENDKKHFHKICGIFNHEFSWILSVDKCNVNSNDIKYSIRFILLVVLDSDTQINKTFSLSIF